MGTVPAVSPSDSPPAWWQRGAIYQIYPRSFADADGDGIGDLRGVIAHLDHLNDGTERSLGVEAIWLSPFYLSPMADFGYDVADYTDVDPLFGTLADFDELVAQAHARGIRVVIDFVPNHTSDRHPWFAEARASRDSPRRDWYVWRDGDERGGDGEPPNDWVSNFAAVGRAWTWDDATRQWYLHSFLPEQPDLNWDEPAVEAALHEAMRFWLDRGVDGFRLDVDPRDRQGPRAAVERGLGPRPPRGLAADHPRAPAAPARAGGRARRQGAGGRGLPPRPRARSSPTSTAARAAPRPQLHLRPPAVGRRGLPREHRRLGGGRQRRRLAGLVPVEPRPPPRRLALRRRRPRAGARAGGAAPALRAAGDARSSSRARSSGSRTRRSRPSGSSTSTARDPERAPVPWERPPSPARAPASRRASRGCRSTRTPSAARRRAGATTGASTFSLARRLAWLRRGDAGPAGRRPAHARRGPRPAGLGARGRRRPRGWPR